MLLCRAQQSTNLKRIKYILGEQWCFCKGYKVIEKVIHFDLFKKLHVQGVLVVLQ